MNWFSELIVSEVLAGKEGSQGLSADRLLFIDSKTAFPLSWIRSFC